MIKDCIIVKFEKGHLKNNKKKDKVIFSGQSLNCLFFFFFWNRCGNLYVQLKANLIDTTPKWSEREASLIRDANIEWHIWKPLKENTILSTRQIIFLS